MACSALGFAACGGHAAIFACYSDFILDRSHKLVGLQSLAACVEESMRKVFRLNFSIVVTFIIITFIYTHHSPLK